MQLLHCATILSGSVLKELGCVAITFEIDGQAVSVALSPETVPALMSVCAALMARSGAEDQALLPVEDWKVGVTASSGLALNLISPNGASLPYLMRTEQAVAMAFELLAAAGRVAAPVETDHRALPDSAAAGSGEIDAMRAIAQGSPETLAIIDACARLLNRLDAANDEGRAFFLASLAALARTARDSLAKHNHHLLPN